MNSPAAVGTTAIQSHRLTCKPTLLAVYRKEGKTGVLSTPQTKAADNSQRVDTKRSPAISGYANAVHARSSRAQPQRETRCRHRLQGGSDIKHDLSGKLGRRPRLKELSRRGESMQIENRSVVAEAGVLVCFSISRISSMPKNNQWRKRCVRLMLPAHTPS